MKRSTIAKTFTIAAVAALALGIAPTAKADDKGCSNATLKGTFAHRATGFVTAPPAMAGPLAGVGTCKPSTEMAVSRPLESISQTAT